MENVTFLFSNQRRDCEKLKIKYQVKDWTTFYKDTRLKLARRRQRFPFKPVSTKGGCNFLVFISEVLFPDGLKS